MLKGLSRRLLTLLQLTRMALVFTAIADSYCTALLRMKVFGDHDVLQPSRMVAIAAMSVGLYGFGMSLNDIADRRRDSQMASHRPLPSGRVGLFTAHIISVLLALGALGAAAYYSQVTHDWWSFFFVVWTGLLISFYDLAGKFLVAPGLLALGSIRFLHCLVPAPRMPVLWHPLLLLNHVTILSAVAYRWEEKRPTLTRIHYWTVGAGLALIDGLCIYVVYSRHRPQGLSLVPGLMVPAAAAIVFAFIARYVRRRSPTSREAGQTVMLYGLLWLIVYDASFVLVYNGWLAAVLLLLLFPAAYFSVQLMRWWSKILTLSQRPTFKRANA